MENTGFSLEDRVLCTDGLCIGTIGEDGLCKACGKAYEGDESLPPIPEPGSSAQPPDETSVERERSPDALEPLAPLEDSDRICCSDDMCVGVLGDDGRCGTCGKEGK